MDTFHIINQKLDALTALLDKCISGTNKTMLNTEEASKLLGISISTLYKHTSAGNIPFYKPNGKLILFKKEDLDAWVESKRIPSNKEILLTQTSLRA